MKIISILFVVLSGPLFANIAIPNNSFPGGIAVIDFLTSHSKPQAFYNNVPLFVQKIRNNQWQAFVGIPLLTELGEKEITVKTDSEQNIKFNVKYRPYEQESINFAGDNNKYLNPNLSHQERIIKERKLLASARKYFSSRALSNSFFIKPINNNISSKFGNRRVINGKDSLPHTGIDLRGNIGESIKSAADGRVILIGDYFFNGKCVFIDHGQGLISAYMHMQKVLVDYGQEIKQGELLGTIGMTGKATGPHLHWSVYLNRTAINPALLLENN